MRRQEATSDRQFRAAEPELHAEVQAILRGLGSEWYFSCFMSFTLDGFENFDIVYNDSNNEDRCVSIQWGHDGTPFENARIIDSTD